MTPPLMAESEEELKSLLMKMKEESEKAGLKLNIQKTMWDSRSDTDIKNRLLYSVREGESGMICENSIETCILSYVKQISSPGSMHETWCSGLVQWDDSEGWDGEEGRRGLQDGEHMYTHGWFMSMYGKNYHIILK